MVATLQRILDGDSRSKCNLVAVGTDSRNILVVIELVVYLVCNSKAAALSHVWGRFDMCQPSMAARKSVHVRLSRFQKFIRPMNVATVGNVFLAVVGWTTRAFVQGRME